MSGLAAVLAAVESVAVFVRVCVFGFGWMVVRFVRVIRLPACARVSRVSRVSEITHRHTFTFTQALHTPRRVPHGGGLKGRHAHGELEAHGGCSERYGSRVRENDGR